MSNPRKPIAGRKRSGGPLKKQDTEKSENTAKYESVPPEDRKAVESSQGPAADVKTIIVHDERGQIVSITKVAPDAKFGVGVKPQPGQVVKEYAAGTLAKDPFPQLQDEPHVDPKTGTTKKKQR